MTQSNLGHNHLPVTINVNQAQLEAIDKRGVILKTKGSELWFPANLEFEDSAPHEPDIIGLSDSLLEAQEILAYLYETTATVFKGSEPF